MPRRRRIRRAFRRMFRPGRIGHIAKGVGYRVGNSFRGINIMRQLGKLRADRDIQRCKSAHGEPGKGRGFCIHWPIPGRHDKLRAPGVPIGEHFRDMTEAQARALHSPDGYHVHTIEDDCKALANGRKIHPIWEPKSEDCNDLQFWIEAVDVAHSHGLTPWGWALPKYHHILPVMKQAGVARVIKLKG